MTQKFSGQSHFIQRALGVPGSFQKKTTGTFNNKFYQFAMFIKWNHWVMHKEGTSCSYKIEMTD